MAGTEADRRRARVALLTVVVLGALLLSIAAMHASMAGAASMAGQHASGHTHASDAAIMPMPATAGIGVHGGTGSPDVMGGMSLMDCLLVGMVCFLAAVAVLLLAVVIGGLRSLLRPRALAQSLRSPLGRLRPPRPPSLVVLSISRT